ncbi:hypothetical protein BJX68DRAFT_246593, partial [Aspergillus pseudodeflectus]
MSARQPVGKIYSGPRVWHVGIGLLVSVHGVCSPFDFRLEPLVSLIFQLGLWPSLSYPARVQLANDGLLPTLQSPWRQRTHAQRHNSFDNSLITRLGVFRRKLNALRCDCDCDLSLRPGRTTRFNRTLVIVDKN